MRRQRMSGKQLQGAIIELAHMYGWKVAHFPTSQVGREGAWRTAYAADGKGFPDLVLVRERVMFVEVKGSGDTLRPEQQEWQRLLRAAGAEAHVWTPKELDDGAVVSWLTAPL